MLIPLLLYALGLPPSFEFSLITSLPIVLIFAIISWDSTLEWSNWKRGVRSLVVALILLCAAYFPLKRQWFREYRPAGSRVGIATSWLSVDDSQCAERFGLSKKKRDELNTRDGYPVSSSPDYAQSRPVCILMTAFNNGDLDAKGVMYQFGPEFFVPAEDRPPDSEDILADININQLRSFTYHAGPQTIGAGKIAIISTGLFPYFAAKRVIDGESGMMLYGVFKYTDKSLKPKEIKSSEIEMYFINDFSQPSFITRGTHLGIKREDPNRSAGAPPSQ